MDKQCKKCLEVKPEEKFGLTNKGKYRLNTCARCLYLVDRKRDPLADARKQQKYRDNYPHKMIVIDSKKSDKRKGFDNNLSFEFVEEAIVNGCSYCGEKNMRISLDRIDNNIGHMQDNVVAACVRCNYMKSDMPNEAWKFLAPAIKQASELGLFGDWRTQAFNRKPRLPPYIPAKKVV